MGMLLSSPSEEKRGDLSAPLPPQCLFPIGQSFPPALTPLHFWVTSCNPIASCLGSQALECGILLSPEVAREARDWLAADPPWTAELPGL